MVFWTPVTEDGYPVFERILEPLAQRVWNSIAEDSNGLAAPLNRSDVFRDTVLRSSAVLADPIYRRFSSMREAHARLSRTFHYSTFEDELLNGGLDALLGKRPALQQLLERVLNNATDAWKELAHAITDDRALLASGGFIGSSTEPIRRLTPGAGDFHDGGRSATRAHFSSGELYYKPRSGATDQVWNALLNEVGSILGINLPTTNILDRGSHYWSTAIEPFKQRDSLNDYYTQLGVLAFLVYVFQGIDFHCENLIASRSGPILVDLEGLLHPSELPDSGLDPATSMTFNRLVHSVINTGLLPCSFEGAGESASVGGMNPPILARSQRVSPVDVHTSEMTFELRQITDYWTDHTPLVKVDEFEDEYIDSILGGFRGAYEACRRGGISGAIGRAFDAFEDVELRFIARPTAFYFNALHELLSAVYDIREVDVRGLLSRYLRSLPDVGVRDEFIEAEVAALAQFDIPRFARSSSDRFVRSAGTVVSDFGRTEAPLTTSRERLRRLSSTDLGFQESILYASFGGLRKVEPRDPAAGAYLSGPEMLESAVDCGRTVLAASVRSESEIAWLAATSVPAQRRTSMIVCGLDLYEGLSGIALFLGELYEMTGESEFKEGAIRCVDTIRRRLQNERSGLGVGGGTGVGGILYAMSRLSANLPESCAPEIGSWLCGELTTETIVADQSLDLIEGCAGLLLGLISLRWIQRHDAHEEACVETLLSALEDADRQGLRSWQTFDSGPCHSGMAHGSSGIAMALGRRYSLSSSERVIRAIKSALSFDDSVDFTCDGVPVQWCHGAPGIALAHWSIGQDIPDLAGRVRVSVDRARNHTGSVAGNVTDGVCCGSMGRAAALFHTGGCNGIAEPAWQTVIASVCRGRQATGTFRWSAGSDSLNPGLFVGVSGVGLELLRMSTGRIGTSPLVFS